jgi:hypothetical protein
LLQIIDIVVRVLGDHDVYLMPVLRHMYAPISGKDMGH